jgi:hypothetical protein
MFEGEPRVADENDLFRLLRSLSDHQVDYVLIGGQALNLHGFMRGTADIDLGSSLFQVGSWNWSLPSTR